MKISLFDNFTQRQIRVFVSSTFRDLDKERDTLIKNIFPQLRQICLERDVEFSEVDLRWGVTERESRQGRVLHICLTEIDKTHPYFIGILGGRYGWIPEEKDLQKHRKVLEDFPWVEKDVGHHLSVTEMEIQYGVLRRDRYHKDSHPKAFFYLKDENSIPDMLKEPEGTPAAKKLLFLKNKIISQKKFPVSIFYDHDHLGELVLSQFQEIIEREFPINAEKNQLQKLRDEHIGFAFNRFHLFVGRTAWFKKLDNYIDTSDKPMVVTGVSGTGKSSLLANWINHRYEKYPDQYIFFHFTGGAIDSTNHYSLIRRLLEEIQVQFQITDKIPADPSKMIKILPEFLGKATIHGRKWILVIDALNQLEEIDQARLLNWLPQHFPPNVRVILSCLEGSMLEILKKRGFLIKQMRGFTIHERKTLVEEYLRHYSKKLSSNLIELIVKDKENENPLILKTLLDELRVFGLHEKLREEISRYINTNSNEEFFEQVLVRLEEDYDVLEKGISCLVLSLIWLSRTGLSEKEIMFVTGMRPLHWSFLYHAIESHLVKKSGLINISHDFFRKAVEKRYLSEKKAIRSKSELLIHYFEKERYSLRALQELPAQYRNSGRWKDLIAYIIDPTVFMILYKQRTIEYLILCNSVRDKCHVGKSFLESLKLLRKQGRFNLTTEMTVVNILHDLAYYDDALMILKRLLNSPEATCNNEKAIQETLYWIGYLYIDKGKCKQALYYYRKCLPLTMKLYDKNDPQVARVLHNIGYASHWIGYNKTAVQYYKKALKIRLGNFEEDNIEIASSYNHLGIIYYDLAEYKKALWYYNKSLKINTKILGSFHSEISETLCNIGLAYNDMGMFQKAKGFYLKSMKIAEEILGEDHPLTATNYSNLGLLYQDLGDLNSSEIYLRKSLKASKRLYGPDNIETATDYCNIAWIYRIKKDIGQAQTYFLKDLKISIKDRGKNNLNTATSYKNVAWTFYMLRQYQKSLELLMKSLRIYKINHKPDHPDLALAYMNLGRTCLKLKQDKQAFKYLNMSRDIYKKRHGNDCTGLADTLDVFGMYYLQANDPEEAQVHLMESLRIKEKQYGNGHYETADTFSLLGETAFLLKDIKSAKELFTKANAIFKKYEIKPDIKQSEAWVRRLS